MKFLAPLAFAFTFTLGLFAQTPPKTNLLLITVDDMSCDSVGVYGCKLKGTSPRMDRLASQSIRFDHAHVTVGNCMPCLASCFPVSTPITTRSKAFTKSRIPVGPIWRICSGTPVTTWPSGARSVIPHPINPMPGTRTLRSCRTVKRLTSKTLLLTGNLPPGGLPMPKRRGKPFFLSVNISDPHKPFWSQVRGQGRPPRPQPDLQGQRSACPRLSLR